jgi:hypothetical protein
LGGVRALSKTVQSRAETDTSRAVAMRFSRWWYAVGTHATRAVLGTSLRGLPRLRLTMMGSAGLLNSTPHNAWIASCACSMAPSACARPLVYQPRMKKHQAIS